MIITVTPLDRMTPGELTAERNRWDHVASNAVVLSAYTAAVECRDACDVMLARHARAAIQRKATAA